MNERYIARLAQELSVKSENLTNDIQKFKDVETELFKLVNEKKDGDLYPGSHRTLAMIIDYLNYIVLDLHEDVKQTSDKTNQLVLLTSKSPLTHTRQK